MYLNKLISRIKPIQVEGLTDRIITNISSDSRKVQTGCLFVALTGTAVDGHDYIDQTIAEGAVAIVCERLPVSINEDIVYIKVKDSADAMGLIASEWFGNPSEKLTLIGVTGTNGKTTIATLLYKLFMGLGEKAGLLSTVCNCVNDQVYEATHTTPDPISLNRLLSKMVEAGCKYAFMEISSHSVVQKRISGLNFGGGVFSNLTRDHLDYHLTVDNYLRAKKEFFDKLPKGAFALTNADDKNGMVMLQNSKASKYSYSIRTIADYNAKIIESHFDGMILEICKKEVVVQFVGKFNALNLLAVIGTAHLLGKGLENILVVLSTLKSVDGRFETIRSSNGVTAIVDYAHTPDALNNVLSAIHQVLEAKGQVITVVGAGGNRDKGKRPLMAKEAVNASEKVILTSDNPRFEEPNDIINDMLNGLNFVDKKKVVVITDREQAIKTACMLAKSGDVILIAGKGHETYQDIKGVKSHFDDREVVRNIFAETNY